MKTIILALLPLMLTGCTITKQAQVSEASAITGVVRLTYNQAMLQTARTDDYVTQGTATKECQRLGYASAQLLIFPTSSFLLVFYHFIIYTLRLISLMRFIPIRIFNK